MTINSSNTDSMEARYQRAQSILQGIFSNKAALNTTLMPVWIGDSNCCWYVRLLKGGKEHRLVNADKQTNDVAFNHQALADALKEHIGEPVDANDLPISQCELSLDPVIVEFTAFEKRWRFEEETGQCTEIEPPLVNGVVSPDGRYFVFKNDHNLWLRDLDSGEERALTQDGEEHFSYGCSGLAWGASMPIELTGLQVQWSPDSKRLFVVQRDTRDVKDLPVVHHVPEDGSTRPQVKYHKVPYPGDDHVETLKLSCINIETGHHQPAAYSQITTTRNNLGLFYSDLAWWNTDSRLAYFVDVDRYYKYARVMEFDTNTGLTRMLFEETSATQINMMANADEPPSLMPLPNTNELLWYSERSGWAHVYLYDMTTGALKHPVTSGEWLVRSLVRYDAARRELFIQTGGRTSGRDPYYLDLVRVNIDSGQLVELASSDHEYTATTKKYQFTITCAAMLGSTYKSNAVSNQGDYAIVTRSRVDEIPVSLLLDRDGRELMSLETAEIIGLPEGWQWPEPVELVAADGKTPIYGVVYRPSDFDPKRSYPVVNHVFNQPEIAWVPKGSFTNYLAGDFSYLDALAMAELGFIVVQIDGRGTVFRSKAFRDESYGNLETVSRIDDHVAGIRQLAERYPYMDTTRVGITAHATGGSGAVQGLLQFPEFYKVGVTYMMHDSRFMPSVMWGDKYEGPVGEIDKLFPEDMAEQLRGKLLLICSMLDVQCSVAASFRLIEALQKANKDPDIVLLPRGAHEPSVYANRRTWDYLVQHLQGTQPPEGFDLGVGCSK